MKHKRFYIPIPFSERWGVLTVSHNYGSGSWGTHFLRRSAVADCKRYLEQSSSSTCLVVRVRDYERCAARMGGSWWNLERIAAGVVGQSVYGQYMGNVRPGTEGSMA